MRFRGRPVIPGDKSISHRGLLFGAMAEGRSEVTGILESGDVQSTARCLRALGVRIESSGDRTWIEGMGTGFRPPAEPLDCGNSGTTMRLLMGVLAGRPLSATLVGDSSLIKRPMRRVAEPLRMMGAKIDLAQDNFAPLTIHGCRLHGIDYDLKIASAQIKSAIILAALTADGVTRISGEIHSRDHSERLLAHYGAKVETLPSGVIQIEGPQRLRSGSLRVPGDPSAAAFWMAAASLVPSASVEMENVSLNPTRIGFLRALQRMGADIAIEITTQEPEPAGSIRVKARELRATEIMPDEVPSLIDELPLIAVLASQAEGRTVVRGAEELRVKESDRIEAVAANLRAMGAKIETLPDGFVIEGPQDLRGAEIESFHDHRIAMAFSIAGLVASGETTILASDCVSISYPAFYETLKELTR